VNWSKDCAAVIPCFNEAARIGPVVQEVRSVLPNVFVVNDGSTDGTSAAARPAFVIEHTSNRGKGAAIHTGLVAAHQRGFSWAALLDGDGQHSPADLPSFFRAADETGARLVIGNRMSNPAPMPALRRFVNRWMSRRLSRAAGQALPDTQCGFRLVHLPSWAKLSLETARFEIESEMLLAFTQAGLRVEFVPIQVIYNSGASKIHPLADTWRWFRWWFSRQRFPATRLPRVQQDASAEI
jgi:glycosyltransferase involved in cell wall biosynthesis